MKLEFARHGKQFFFVTMVVAERRPVLSRVVSENLRPELTALGEIVKAGLLAVHKVWPMVIVSDFIIMPDHFHFLLIVDYDRVKGVSPLYVAHRLADAVEMAAAGDMERTGAGACEERRVMSDELVGKMVRFMGVAIEAANEAGELRVEKGLRFGERVGGSGARAPVRSIVFARDCYIELSFDARQLKATRHYMKLNPSRYIWKRRNPAAAHAFRRNCLAMNDIAAKLCAC